MSKLKKSKKEKDIESVKAVYEPKSDMIALKDHHLFCPPKVDIKIKEGDDLSGKMPESFHQTLVTEGVLKGK